jgi:hypothetical protein
MSQLEPFKQTCHAWAMKKKAAKPKNRANHRKPTRPTDVNQIGYALVQQSTQEAQATEPAEPTQSEVSRVMAALGRKGGKVGGKRRSDSLPPERRREIALKAARARWGS